jgi:hypothetical protein
MAPTPSILGRKLPLWLRLGQTAIAALALFGVPLTAQQTGALVLIFEAALALVAGERRRRRRAWRRRRTSPSCKSPIEPS